MQNMFAVRAVVGSACTVSQPERIHPQALGLSERNQLPESAECVRTFRE